MKKQKEPGCFWGIFLFVAFCAALAMGNIPITILAAIGEIYWWYLLIKWQPPAKPPATKKNGGSDGEGYTGSTHYGEGTPTSVRTGNGTTVDTHGFGWRETYTGGRVGPHGESLEKDVFGNWQYTDSDGDTDDYATFGFDDDD